MRRLVNFTIVAAVCVSFFMLGMLYQIMVMDVMPAGQSTASQGPLTITAETSVDEKQKQKQALRYDTQPSSDFMGGNAARNEDMTQRRQDLHNMQHLQNVPHVISDAKRTVKTHHVDVDDDMPVPPVVQAWRAGKVDWHDLIPQHNTFLERFGDSADSKFNFMKLVAKEEAITSYLTRYRESGLEAEYGRDHGKLLSYSGCNLLQDDCMIHDEQGCKVDEFCTWEHQRGLCIERSAPGSAESCTAPQMFNDNSHKRIDPSQCSSFVHQPVVVDAVKGDPASMFYHWWGHFQHVYGAWQANGADRNVHFILTQYPVTKFFHYYGLMSNSCWRRAHSIPKGTCFCHVVPSTRSNKASTPDIVAQMLDFFGIDRDAPPTKPMMGLISRRDKRFILNENKLVQAAKEFDFDVMILPLEKMTLYEQLRALRQVTLLVGIHGSGLNNSLFMHRNTVILQILTYNLNYKGAFAKVARESHVTYLEMAHTNKNQSLFHWDFVGDQQLRAVGGNRDLFLAKGSSSGPSVETYTFWINQDLVIDIEAFKVQLIQARRTGFNSVLFGYDV